jgi:hypothetical protein
MKSDELARGVVEPLLGGRFFTPASPVALRDEEIVSSDEGDAEGPEGPSQMNAPFKLPVAQQAQVAWTLSEVLVRLDRLNEALPYLQMAHRLEKAPTRREQIGKTMADVRSRLRRQQLNAARQPILHEALEQDRLVRPRLLARAAPPAKAAAAKKGVKR